MRTAKVAAVVVAASALIAACGSYTKADFVAAANAICVNAVHDTRTLTPPSFASGAAGLTALGAYVGRVVPIVRTEARQLRALRRPKQRAREGKALTRYLDALPKVLAAYTALAVAAKRGDPGGVARAEGALRSSPVAALAAGYGLRSCANPGATVS